MRRIVCKNVNNMRDLGGYCNKEGKVIKFNRFIRSNFPYEMTDQEINYLLNNKINTVIDLRRKDEVARKKNDARLLALLNEATDNPEKSKFPDFLGK